MCCVLKFIFRFYNFNVTSCYIFQFSAVSTHCIFYLLEHTNRHYFKATNDQLSREKDEKEAIFGGRLAKRFQISAIQPHAQQAPHSRNGLSIRSSIWEKVLEQGTEVPSLLTAGGQMGPRGPSACGWDPHGTEGWGCRGGVTAGRVGASSPFGGGRSGF